MTQFNSPGGERGKQPEAMAIQGRLLQESIADCPPDERKAFLEEWLTRQTSGMLPAERTDFLDKLAQHFPAFGEIRAVGQPAPMNLEELVAELERGAGTSPEARQKVLQLLAARGLGFSIMPKDFMRQLRAKLGISDQRKIEASRVLELMLLLTDFAISIDAHVYDVWNALAQTRVRCALSLRELIIQFLGAADSGDGKVVPRLARLGQRLQLLTGAFRSFSQNWAEKFSPQGIQQMCEGGWRKKHEQYWTKYVELCGGEERDQLENELLVNYGTVLDRTARAGNLPSED